MCITSQKFSTCHKKLTMTWRWECVCSRVLRPCRCEVCRVAREESVLWLKGEGWQARALQLRQLFSSPFALQWFSHQPNLLNQGPASTKTANYAHMSCFAAPLLSSPTFFGHSLRFFIRLPLFFFLLQVTVTWENTALLLGSVVPLQFKLGPSNEEEEGLKCLTMEALIVAVL